MKLIHINKINFVITFSWCITYTCRKFVCIHLKKIIERKLQTTHRWKNEKLKIAKRVCLPTSCLIANFQHQLVVTGPNMYFSAGCQMRLECWKGDVGKEERKNNKVKATRFPMIVIVIKNDIFLFLFAVEL